MPPFQKKIYIYMLKENMRRFEIQQKEMCLLFPSAFNNSAPGLESWGHAVELNEENHSIVSRFR